MWLGGLQRVASKLSTRVTVMAGGRVLAEEQGSLGAPISLRVQALLHGGPPTNSQLMHGQGAWAHKFHRPASILATTASRQPLHAPFSDCTEWRACALL